MCELLQWYNSAKRPPLQKLREALLHQKAEPHIHLLGDVIKAPSLFNAYVMDAREYLGLWYNRHSAAESGR